MIRSDYLHSVLIPEQLDVMICRAQQELECVKFDSIAFRGLSGALFAPILAFSLHKPVTAIRKPGEGSHSYTPVEGCVEPGLKYIIVDDFSASGSTIHAIREAIRSVVPDSYCVAAYYYTRSERLVLDPFNIPGWRSYEALIQVTKREDQSDASRVAERALDRPPIQWFSVDTVRQMQSTLLDKKPGDIPF
jgi:hypothetical protein